MQLRKPEKHQEKHMKLNDKPRRHYHSPRYWSNVINSDLIQLMVTVTVYFIHCNLHLHKKVPTDWDLLSYFKRFSVIRTKEVGATLELRYSFTPVFTDVEHCDERKTSETKSKISIEKKYEKEFPSTCKKITI